MKKILFILPPNIIFKEFFYPAKHNTRLISKNDGREYGVVFTDMPLGCLSLSAYIKSKCQDIDTKLINFNTLLYTLKTSHLQNSFYSLFYEYLNEMSQEYKPDIICISSLFMSNYQSTIELSKICKILFPNAVLILGGGVPTNLYREIFQENINIDKIS